jgi:hypothetical protein
MRMVIFMMDSGTKDRYMGTVSTTTIRKMQTMKVFGRKGSFAGKRIAVMNTIFNFDNNNL